MCTTVACVLSVYAVTALGWRSLEPVLPSAPIGSQEFQQHVMRFVDQVDPDVVISSWPNKAFVPLGRFNRRSVARHSRLQHERNVQLGIAPRASTAWSEPPIADSFAGEPSTTVLRGNDKVPYTVKGTREVVQELQSFSGRLYDKEFAGRTFKGAEQYLNKMTRLSQRRSREVFAANES